MTNEVRIAIDQIAATHKHSNLVVAEDQDGGACVLLEGVSLGRPYAQSDTWIGFHITDACPYADVYPHFVRGDLQRLDGASLGEGISGGHSWPKPKVLRDPTRIGPRPALQLSRRSNKRDGSGLETPSLKLEKVLRWLLSR